METKSPKDEGEQPMMTFHHKWAERRMEGAVWWYGELLAVYRAAKNKDNQALLAIAFGRTEAAISWIWSWCHEEERDFQARSYNNISKIIALIRTSGEKEATIEQMSPRDLVEIMQWADWHCVRCGGLPPVHHAQCKFCMAIDCCTPGASSLDWMCERCSRSPRTTNQKGKPRWEE